MLILQRKQGQKIVVSDTCHIKILEIRGNRVVLGVEAPRGTPVHRYEVWTEIQDLKEQASAKSNQAESEAADSDNAYQSYQYDGEPGD